MKTKKLLPLLTVLLTLAACGGDGDDIIVQHNTQKSGNTVVNNNRNLIGPLEAQTRYEFPKLQGGNSEAIIHSTVTYGMNYALEWDHQKRATRWVCWRMDATNRQERYSRPSEDPWAYDPLVPENEQHTFGVVFLTSVDSKDYYNFSYKDMDESCGPFSYDCPESILKLLSPTDNEFALNWRKKCREHLQKRKTLKNAPIGTTIEFVFTGSGKSEFEGKTIQFYKHRPAYQFRKPFWFSEKYGMYIQERLIPDDYKIVG